MAFMYVLLAASLLFSSLAARADEFSGFRIPSHRVLGLSARADGSLSDSWHKPIDGRASDFSGRASLGADLFALSETDRARLEISSSLSGDGLFDVFKSRSRSETASPETSFREDRRTDEALYVIGDGLLYPWEPPVGIRGSISFDVRTSQYWHGDRVTIDQFIPQRFTNDSEIWYYRYDVRGDLSFGYGRVRDVTGVAQSLISNDRLRRDGVISQDLSLATRQRLADLFYRRGDYSTRHEYSSKYFWRDVEQVLRNDPAFAGRTPDAYTLYRLAESGHVGNEFRETGWFAGPLLSGSHRTDLQRYWQRQTSPESSGESSFRGSMTFDRLLAGVMGEYHRPLGLKWQFDFRSDLLFPVRPDDEPGMDWSTHASAAYFITDRWFASLSLDHNRYDFRERANWGYLSQPAYRISSWVVHSNLSVQYRVEDHLNLQFAINQSQYAVKRHPEDSRMDRFQAITSDAYVSLGVVYHIIGVGLHGGKRAPRAREPEMPFSPPGLY